MNNNVEQFSNILMVILIFLVIILFILAIVYISIKAKENSPADLNNNNNKEKDKKNASAEKTGATQILNKQSILNFMEFDKVEDNMIIQKGRKKIHNGCRMPRY